jgi:nucleotide-binding universal stress UspA family protein
MLKKILVPLDGSALAERALTYATALATTSGPDLVLLRVALPHALIGVDSDERQAAANREAELYLEDAAAWVREGGFVCETVVSYSHAAECIVDLARRSAADLIVMTTHGRTGPGRWIFGSVTESVVANSSVPVLVERALGPLFGGPLWSDIPEVLVTVDGSAFAESALEAAAGLTEALHGKLVLVRVGEAPSDIGNAMEYVPLAEARLAAKHPTLPILMDIRIGEAAYGIQEAAVDRDAALVVMATHGRSGAKRAIVGSIAGKILRHASVPVVLLNPAQVEDAHAVPKIQVEVTAS